MATDVRVEQRTVIKFCYESGMTPLDTLKQVKQVESHRNVSRALVYKLFSRFREGKPAQEPMGRPPLKNMGNVTKVESQGPVQFYIIPYPLPLYSKTDKGAIGSNTCHLPEAVTSVSHVRMTNNLYHFVQKCFYLIT